NTTLCNTDRVSVGRQNLNSGAGEDAAFIEALLLVVVEAGARLNGQTIGQLEIDLAEQREAVALDELSVARRQAVQNVVRDLLSIRQRPTAGVGTLNLQTLRIDTLAEAESAENHVQVFAGVVEPEFLRILVLLRRVLRFADDR